MKAASTMKSSATVEAAATAEAAATDVAATMEAATNSAASEVGGSASDGSGPEARPAEIAGVAIKPRPTIKARVSIKAMEPRTCSDENSAGEPTRPVVAIRRARIRVIRIVAVGAHRRRTNVGWIANPNTDHNPLRMCVGCENEAYAKYRKNFQVSHFRLPLKSRKTQLRLNASKNSSRLST